MKRFLSQYAKLPNEVQNDVAEVDYTATKKERHQLHFFMNDGNEVYAVLNTFAKKMKYYPEISASMKKGELWTYKSVHTRIRGGKVMNRQLVRRRLTRRKREVNRPVAKKFIKC